MGPRSAPALTPAVLLLAGTRLGLALERPSIPLGLAVAGLGVALGTRRGIWLTCLAVGLTAAWTSRAAKPEETPAWLDTERPVVLTLRRIGSWKGDPNGRWTRARGLVLRQGARVAPWRVELTLWVGGTGEPPGEAGLRVRGFVDRATAPANGIGRRSGHWRLTAKTARFLEADPLAAPSVFASSIRGVREEVKAALEALPRGHGRAMARALVLGERDEVPPDWQRGLRRSGLSHLLAISGLHVALLTGLLLPPTSWLPRWTRLLILAAAIPAYLVLAGPRPSLVRASVMALLAWNGFWVGRPTVNVNALACAAGGMVLAEPGLVMDLGFRLSLSATAGILLVGSRLEERWQGLPAKVRRPLAAAIGAQVSTLPWVLPAFGLMAPLAPLWNLLAIPWTALCLAACLGLALSAVVAPDLALLWLPAVSCLARPFGLPGALAPGPWRPALVDPSRPGAALTAGLLFWLLLGRNRRRWLVLPLLWLVLARPHAPAVPSLTMIDVGQGDALLLRDRGGALLVDGGGWSNGDVAGRILVPVLARRGIRRLAAVAMTHSDLDHCGGLVGLAAYVEIGEVWTTPGGPGSDCARRLLAQPGLTHRFLWAGETRRLGRWRLTAAHPRAGDRGRGNDRSLVLVAEAPGGRILLTGDVEAAGELEITSGHRSPLGPVDVLKVAHHGSASSTTARLLELVRPRLALVSAGVGNRYGHPSPRVLERLESRAIPVLRTDRDGLVSVFFPGDGRLEVKMPAAPRGEGPDGP